MRVCVCVCTRVHVLVCARVTVHVYPPPSDRSNTQRRLQPEGVSRVSIAGGGRRIKSSGGSAGSVQLGR
jgi:hypothetical protein